MTWPRERVFGRTRRAATCGTSSAARRQRCHARLLPPRDRQSAHLERLPRLVGEGVVTGRAVAPSGRRGDPRARARARALVARGCALVACGPIGCSPRPPAARTEPACQHSCVARIDVRDFGSADPCRAPAARPDPRARSVWVELPYSPICVTPPDSVKCASTRSAGLVGRQRLLRDSCHAHLRRWSTTAAVCL